MTDLIDIISNNCGEVVWAKEWKELSASIGKIENILFKVPSKIDDSDCWSDQLKEYLDEIDTIVSNELPCVDAMEAKNDQYIEQVDYWQENGRFLDSMIDDVVDMFGGISIIFNSNSEVQDWCHKTLTDKFLYYSVDSKNSIIIFKSKSDAVLFKLRWV